MKTIEQLLMVSNAYESKKVVLTKALAYVKASQQAYRRAVELSNLSKKENGILHSLDGHRLHPFVTFSTKDKWERKAEIAKRWSDRQFKMAVNFTSKFFQNVSLDNSLDI